MLVWVRYGSVFADALIVASNPLLPMARRPSPGSFPWIELSAMKKHGRLYGGVSPRMHALLADF